MISWMKCLRAPSNYLKSLGLKEVTLFRIWTLKPFVFQLTPVNHSIYNNSCYKLNTYYTFAEFYFLLITFCIAHTSSSRKMMMHMHMAYCVQHNPWKIRNSNYLINSLVTDKIATLIIKKSYNLWLQFLIKSKIQNFINFID